ncbi:hypothetical protein A3D84_01310 [Candidatus Woesebacteria bacterium RIFCSPHIGHO2_02_FULL_42_20]|uniref:Methyltransferase type 12 domain-containing protein n=1 Tax=Candidatus Woesebacteria bacterium RIFCSPHIGHO2_12_FULL_41_24 TaxID=1802510 RepID=A0A1F8ARU4_9BACT|nr:MAG: hypothetical protein A2W15_05525 [Candidatus Woesebacteria bacterium RBG_16_41_13]OGM30909.1 MAG: hypothetical protein A2873_03840 [Candidatus Woesebacteria bacterium RIFCSPHIGHO2_01_FULL_42_80]OGM35878.1 MAG: hypothetical protein A3D84_01310 [Candidatus Woesebacteria bacterium RIFCSPHIGHO2_02_FULL_42_20]OGM54229.1 MAG: hypothetical protein A3E44_00945 [Candidatus Woesebacteria bacterium RIFCSPHIGHO2_12_FULL_41_24]OGM66128.1 MAG: hypothetical protein A2969_04165 [Candidatus Woesebacteri
MRASVRSYDTYDYPAYWQNRSYEHKSELLALTRLLSQIPEIETLADIGGGFGRLINVYNPRAKRIYLIDPSIKLLTKARKDFARFKKIKYVHSSLENLLAKKFRNKFDVIVMVRVMHHIWDIDRCFEILAKLTNKNAYLILEFANKTHWKALLTKFLHGDFTFPLDIFSIDRRSKISKKKNAIAFLNHHPDVIIRKLEQNNFRVVDKLSVSNLRNSLIKNHLAEETLLSIEKKIQKPFAKVNFGPSIFILAKKI